MFIKATASESLFSQDRNSPEQDILNVLYDVEKLGGPSTLAVIQKRTPWSRDFMKTKGSLSRSKEPAIGT